MGDKKEATASDGGVDAGEPDGATLATEICASDDGIAQADPLADAPIDRGRATARRGMAPSEIPPPPDHRIAAALLEDLDYEEKAAASGPPPEDSLTSRATEWRDTLVEIAPPPNHRLAAALLEDPDYDKKVAASGPPPATASSARSTEWRDTPAEIAPPPNHRVAAALLEDPDYDAKVAATKPQVLDDVESSAVSDHIAFSHDAGEDIEAPTRPALFEPTMAGEAVGRAGDSDSVVTPTAEEIDGGAEFVSRRALADADAVINNDVDTDPGDGQRAAPANAPTSHLASRTVLSAFVSARRWASSLFEVPVAWAVTDSNAWAATGSNASPPAPAASFEGEVIAAQRVGFFEHNWRAFMAGLSAVFVLTLVVLLSVFLTREEAPAFEEGGRASEEGGRARYCDPCIDRTAYTIRAVLSDADDLLAPARQAARDMRVNLDLKFYPNGGASDEQMSDDIRSSVKPEAGVDALVVTIPSKTVANAVRYAAKHGMPVFGTNSGFDLVSGPGGLIEDGSLLFFTGMDERSGGKKAASYFLEAFAGENVEESDAASLASFTNALFLSPPRTMNPAYQQRFEGYRDMIMEASDNSIKAEWIEVDPQSEWTLREKLSNCSYQSVLVGQGKLASEVVDPILAEEGCQKVKVGTFDTAAEVEGLIAKDRMEFAIGQFNQLQGWAPVHFAALYVTTGLVLVPPPDGVHHSGPVLLTKNNFTTDRSRNCTQNVLVTGPRAKGKEGLPSDSKCIHRKDITIGGVVHGVQGGFWDTVFAGARQGAIDMGVALRFDRFDLQENSDILHQKMSAQIQTLCESGVDGLFVTLPDDIVVDAVRSCKSSNPNIQIMSITAGRVESREMDLIHHTAVVETDAGYQVGQRMVNMAIFDKAICLNNRPMHIGYQERCEGFKKAMVEMGIEYLHIDAPDEDINFTSTVEMAIGESGDWGDYGILLPELSLLPGALKLKELHKNVAMVTFGVNDVVRNALETDRVLFGVNYQSYLQGYLPIPILTHAVAEKQHFLDHQLRSGPSFLIALDEKVRCKVQNFPVCPEVGTS